MRYVAYKPCPSQTSCSENIILGNKAMTIYQPYAHTEPSALEIVSKLIHTGNDYMGLAFSVPEYIDDHRFTQFLNHYRSALAAARFPQSESQRSGPLTQRSSVSLICAPPCETFIGDRVRAIKGPDRYGRRGLRLEDAKAVKMDTCMMLRAVSMCRTALE